MQSNYLSSTKNDARGVPARFPVPTRATRFGQCRSVDYLDRLCHNRTVPSACLRNNTWKKGSTEPRWPAGSQLTLSTEHPTMIMFAHPRCPCTRASIGELARIMAHAQGKVSAQVLFFEPEGASPDWAYTDLWQSAEQIPGVSVHRDPAGRESEKFGATTSGYLVLFDAQGKLLFHGGITGSRGHFGDNAGKSAIDALLAEQSPATNQSLVFGCSLQEMNQSACGPEE